jgi:hypothetical protein
MLSIMSAALDWLQTMAVLAATAGTVLPLPPVTCPPHLPCRPTLSAQRASSHLKQVGAAALESCAVGSLNAAEACISELGAAGYQQLQRDYIPF